MGIQNATDLSFYSLVHHVLESSRAEDELAERRQGNRRHFSCLQWLAPYRNGRLPEGGDFHRVQCLDLSSGGFSFLADDAVDYEYVVVALGAQQTLFVSAEIVRRTVVPFEGQDRVQIGCRFVAKLDGAGYRPKLPPN